MRLCWLSCGAKGREDLDCASPRRQAQRVRARGLGDEVARRGEVTRGDAERLGGGDCRDEGGEVGVVCGGVLSDLPEICGREAIICKEEEADLPCRSHRCRPAWRRSDAKTTQRRTGCRDVRGRAPPAAPRDT